MTNVPRSSRRNGAAHAIAVLGPAQLRRDQFACLMRVGFAGLAIMILGVIATAMA